MGPARTGLCASAQILVVLAGLTWLYVVALSLLIVCTDNKQYSEMISSSSINH